MGAGKDGRAIQLEPWPMCARIADAEQVSLWLNDNNTFAENMASVCGKRRMRVRVALSSKLQNQFNKIAANENVSMVCGCLFFQLCFAEVFFLLFAFSFIVSFHNFLHCANI